jgi:hypothetical protein
MPNSAILSGITIVVVEDYSATLYAIAQFLTRHGAKVFPSPDALETSDSQRTSVFRKLFAPGYSARARNLEGPHLSAEDVASASLPRELFAVR